MNTFVLHLQEATRTERIPGVVSFVGSDRSGQFGIQANHERVMTVLGLGLARFRGEEGPWQYVGLAGGLLYFVENALFVCTTRYLRDEHRERLARALDEELRREHVQLQESRESMQRLEEEMLRRLWRMPGGEAF